MEERRRLFYNKLSENLKQIDFSAKSLKSKVTKGKLELWFDDGMYVLIDITTLVTHHKKGEFGVDFGINIYSGKIFKLLHELKLFNEYPIYNRERFYVATHHNFVPKHENDGLYNFYLDVDIETEVKKIVTHLKQYALPIVYGFQENYEYLLNIYDKPIIGIYAGLSNPFYIGIILCILNGTEDRMDDIISYARGEHASRYTDFVEKDYQLGVMKVKEALMKSIDKK
ncbi:hypothetical protein LNQ81_12830 [Myroides sp. M-43]|uniref:hypothetical protein n=1 Tax=Myroides oncorhynchi TaxID=2893756 RepID=UPI001E4DFAB3|nr:hypothetical protein [Myroides oncorhynchi]MCC9043558.1 hypothetical protein [Myroides oncorhynchi]